MTREQVVEKIIAAQNALRDACVQGGHIRMTIPVHPNDTDVVIAEGLRAALEYVAMTPR